MADFDILVDNRSATYPSWPLIFIEMQGNMPALDPYTFLPDDAPVIDIHRVESPNFGRRMFIYQITLTPEPTSEDPVRVYIDTQNRQVYVDPDSSHAQAGELLHVLHPATRFIDLLPGNVNWISINNAPDTEEFTFGVRWRKAYSG